MKQIVIIFLQVEKEVVQKLNKQVEDLQKEITKNVIYLICKNKLKYCNLNVILYERNTSDSKLKDFRPFHTKRQRCTCIHIFCRQEWKKEIGGTVANDTIHTWR